jgi:hypothetical protein
VGANVTAIRILREMEYRNCKHTTKRNLTGRACAIGTTGYRDSYEGNEVQRLHQNKGTASQQHTQDINICSYIVIVVVIVIVINTP